MIKAFFAYESQKKLIFTPFASMEPAGRMEKSLRSMNSSEKKPLYSDSTNPLSRRTGQSHTTNLMLLFSFIFLTFNCAHALFDYERAIIQTQKNNWPAAQELLTNVIVENPERPDVLYDFGVTSYKNNNFDTALSYFNKAANHMHANSELQQQAHFNAGNTHVQLKQLHEAIDAYDRVLALKPDHKQALHNKEMVKKMLEQQKQEQQDKDQNKDEQQKDQDNQDKQNEDNNKEQKRNKDDQNQEDQQSDEDKSMADRDKQQKNQQDSKNQDQQNKKDEEKKKDQKSSDAKDKEDKNSDQSNADKSEEQKDESGIEQKKQSGSQQDKELQKPKQRDGVAQADQKPGQPEQKLSAGLARVLEDREKKDAQLNKKMTKALVANQGGSKNDYNCW